MTGTRSDKAPDMILAEVPEMESMRLSTRLAVSPPATTDNTTMPSTPRQKPWKTMAEKPRRSTMSRPTTSRRPLGSVTERATRIAGRIRAARLSPRLSARVAVVVEGVEPVLGQDVVRQAGDIADQPVAEIVAEIVDAGPGPVGEALHGKGHGLRTLLLFDRGRTG